MSAVDVAAAPPAAAADGIHWSGLAAVLMGTFISTLTGRLSTFGLADIRGAVHAGFDDGAWITTAQTVAQMLVTPLSVWLGGMFGPRRCLQWASLAFAVVELIEPAARDLPSLLACQVLSGMASGFFIPLTLSFILRNMPPKYWAWGIALYALNLELSLNISASLEGFWVDHLSWRWIFWQNVPLGLAMALFTRMGGAREAPPTGAPPLNSFGLAAGGLGLALIYAALDQGNRVDWLHSGLIVGVFAAGAVLTIAFLAHEMRLARPSLDMKVLIAEPLPRLLMLVAFLRLTILSTAYLVPLYLGSVRGFRALDTGQALIWVAIPQLLFCPLAGLMLRRTDPRVVACIGFVFIAVSCLMVAHQLTDAWGTDQFLPSSLLQAVGQSFALSGVVFFAVLNLRPQDALTFGAGLQVARLLGGEAGTAFVATLARVRGQVASNHLGLSVRIGDGQLTQTLGLIARLTGGGSPDGPRSGARGVALLTQAVRRAATSQAVIDCYVVLAAMTALALLLVVLSRSPPEHPAGFRPMLPARRGGP